VLRLGGSAEHLPLVDGSCDAAWLSNVVHHFDDVNAAARELRRVLAEDAPVLIRGAFGGRPIATLYDFFPGTEKTVDSFPSVNDMVDAFQSAGFASFSLEKVEQLLARTMSEMVERIKLRADTTLELLSDEEFAEGVRRMEEAAEQDDGPVLDYLDLLVLR
jgi:ubiquinone/menaquinone biosynthesis C-methylase UbiE